MGETKLEAVTAVYKVHIHCSQCARDIETHFTEFHGVREVKVDAGAGRVTVKGTGFDVEKLRVKVQKGCRKKVELIPPKKDIVYEIKTKKEELKVITVKVPLHCPRCEARVKEILLQHKSIYAVKTNLGKNTCVIEGVIEEKKLVEYIFEKTHKRCHIDKVEKKVIIIEDKVEVKKKEGKGVVIKETEVIKEKVKDIVAPYFIPCTHPEFIDYSHPRSYRGGFGGDYYSPCGGYGYDGYSPWGGYGYGGYGYPYNVSYSHSEFKGYQDTAFLHCTHPHEFLSEENPYACSVM